MIGQVRVETRHPGACLHGGRELVGEKEEAAWPIARLQERINGGPLLTLNLLEQRCTVQLVGTLTGSWTVCACRRGGDHGVFGTCCTVVHSIDLGSASADYCVQCSLRFLTFQDPHDQRSRLGCHFRVQDAHPFTHHFMSQNLSIKKV
jgi:hypothetical protein